MRRRERDAEQSTKRYLFVNERITASGGVSNSFLRVIEAAGDRLSRPAMVSFTPVDAEMRRRCDAQGVELLQGRGRSFLSQVLLVRRVIRRVAPAGVVVRSFRSFVVVSLAQLTIVRHRQMGRPVLTYWHGNLALGLSNLSRRLFYVVAARFWREVFVTPASATAAGRSLNQATVVRHAIGPSKASPVRIRQSLPEPQQSAFLVGYVGAPVSLKNHAPLIEAVRNFNEDDGISVVLVLIGDVIGELNLRQVVDELHAGSYVFFVGQVPDARAYLGSLDLYCHPCPVEAFGWSVLEAMAEGTPTVIARSGALVDWVLPASTVFVTNHASAEEWLEAIRFAYSHPEDMQRIRERAFRVVGEVDPWVWAQAVLALPEKGVR